MDSDVIVLVIYLKPKPLMRVLQMPACQDSKVHNPPPNSDNYVTPPPDLKSDEAQFEDVDNPGDGWNNRKKKDDMGYTQNDMNTHHHEIM